MPAGDFFGDMMNAPKKYVVSKTLQKPIWRNTTIIRDNVIESVRALKAKPGKNILMDGSSQLVHALLEHDLIDEIHLTVYPLTLGNKICVPNNCCLIPLTSMTYISISWLAPPSASRSCHSEAQPS